MATAVNRIKKQINHFIRKGHSVEVQETYLKPRAILKNGDYNIIQPKFSKRYLHYVKDTFVSLVDAEWKWTVQAMILGFTGSWLTFALLWWLIAFVHKDLHDEHLPSKQAENGWTPCVLNIYGFHSCFLYSLENQSSIGYGFRVITEECPEAIFLLCAQCIIGTIIDSFTVGALFAKLIRPRLTAYTVQFSRNAVVCIQDEQYCLMLRIGDLRKCRLIGVSIKAFLIHNVTSKEGEELEHFETELQVQCDDTGSEPFYLWPINLVHKINKTSPFFNLSASEFLTKKFELVVILDGTIESTGQNTNARTSYLEYEILWGKKFQNMVLYNHEMECYEADYKMFDKIKCAPAMPICSAAEYENLSKETDHSLNYETYLHQDIQKINNGSTKKSKWDERIIKNEDFQFRSETPPFPDIWVDRSNCTELQNGFILR